MRKRSIGLALALLILGTSSLAFATGVPSKTTQDMTTVVSIVSETGVELPPGFQIIPLVATESATRELAAIQSFVTTPNATVVQYFDVAVREEIAKLLPEGFDLDTLSMNEFLPITVVNYEESYGDVAATFQFATQYQEGQPVVALVGITDEVTGVVAWTVLKAEVVDGLVKIHFTQDILLKIQSGDAMLAILNGEAAAN